MTAGVARPTSASEPESMTQRLFKVAEIISRTHRSTEWERHPTKPGSEKQEDREIEYRESDD